MVRGLRFNAAFIVSSLGHFAFFHVIRLPVQSHSDNHQKVIVFESLPREYSLETPKHHRNLVITSTGKEEKSFHTVQATALALKQLGTGTPRPKGSGPPPQGILTWSLKSVLAEGNRAPGYPEAARVQEMEGLVVVRVSVLETGWVCCDTIEQSSGYDLLDNAAVEAARSWRFPRWWAKHSIRVPISFALTPN